MVKFGSLSRLFVVFLISIGLAIAACSTDNTEEINQAVTEAVAEEKARAAAETKTAVTAAVAAENSRVAAESKTEVAEAIADEKKRAATEAKAAITEAVAEEKARAAAEAKAAEAEAAKPLVIYAGRSESLVGPIIEQFRDATGYTVDVKYAKTGELAATLLEEGAKSPADVFFAQDPGGLGRVEAQLSTLPSDIVQLAPEWARSKDGKWVGTSGRARAVVYNSAKFSPSDLPDDLWGFTDPQWKGRIGWAPTNASFQAMVTGMRIAWGEEKAKEWLVAIQANEPNVYPKNTPQVAAAAAGEIDVGLVNHYYLHRFISSEGENFAARNYHPRGGGPGALVMVAGAGVLESSDNKEKAQAFIQFMLSKVAQQYFASQTYEYPLIDGVKTPLTLVAFDDIKSPAISAGDLTDGEGTIKLLQEAGVLP